MVALALCGDSWASFPTSWLVSATSGALAGALQGHGSQAVPEEWTPVAAEGGGYLLGSGSYAGPAQVPVDRGEGQGSTCTGATQPRRRTRPAICSRTWQGRTWARETSQARVDEGTCGTAKAWVRGGAGKGRRDLLSTPSPLKCTVRPRSPKIKYFCEQETVYLANLCEIKLGILFKSLKKHFF